MRVHSLELIGDAMLPKPEPACLVMADISGYTGYLAGVELDHAQDILADLIDTIVGALRPPFRCRSSKGTRPSSISCTGVRRLASAGHVESDVFHIPPAAA